jgi:hypothetical protein
MGEKHDPAANAREAAQAANCKCSGNMPAKIPSGRYCWPSGWEYRSCRFIAQMNGLTDACSAEPLGRGFDEKITLFCVQTSVAAER